MARGARARSAREAAEAIADGVNILILSDRDVGARARRRSRRCWRSPAVHHHLVREGTRLQAGLVLESGEPREVHHFATLIGYGASAINPYLMFESLDELVADGRVPDGMTPTRPRRNVVKGIGKGLLKTISKMGISTIQSYSGAQIFEAVGLAPELIDAPLHRHRVADRRHRPRRARARDARPPRARLPARARRPAAGRRRLRVAPRRRAPHVEPGDDRAAPARRPPRRPAETYEEYSRADERGRRAPRDAARAAAVPASCPRTSGSPLDEVEPASEIVKRFATGAMSLGSLSREAHETLAIAMNRIGGKSNTGEGGEDPVALHARPERRLAPLGDQAGRLRAASA